MKLRWWRIRELGNRLEINDLIDRGLLLGANSIQRLTQAVETVGDEAGMIHNLVKFADSRLDVAVNKT